MPAAEPYKLWTAAAGVRLLPLDACFLVPSIPPASHRPAVLPCLLLLQICCRAAAAVRKAGGREKEVPRCHGKGGEAEAKTQETAFEPVLIQGVPMVGNNERTDTVWLQMTSYCLQIFRIEIDIGYNIHA